MVNCFLNLINGLGERFTRFLHLALKLFLAGLTFLFRFDISRHSLPPYRPTLCKTLSGAILDMSRFLAYGATRPGQEWVHTPLTLDSPRVSGGCCGQRHQVPGHELW